MHLLPQLDIATLLFVYQMTAALLAMVIVGGAWQARGRYGLWFWAGFFAAIAISQSLRGAAIIAWGEPATPPIGHIGGIVAAALLLLGVHSYLERPLHALPIMLLAGLFSAFSLFSFYSGQMGWVSLSVSVFAAGLLRLAAFAALLAATRRVGGFPLAMATAVIGLSALTELLRSVTVAVPVSGSVALAETINGFWLTLYIALTMLQGFVILILINDSLQRDIRSLIEHDPLTGLLNRRGLFHRYEVLTRLASRDAGSPPIVVAMADVDRFKQINDRHGHGIGDQVLQTLGRRIEELMRTSDLAVRMGGEEFAVVWIGSGPEHAFELGERLRKTIESQPIETDAGPLEVTLSLGVTTMRPAGETLNDLLARADRALYRAKSEGRNRTIRVS
ncbi:MAG: GGDEF domain-containing protein [Xanthomonadaceae bacterium]|nr:GGDEF domain-containing protein [Xanthomonadaceae bacterium]